MEKNVLSRTALRLGLIFLICQILVIFSSWRFLPPKLPLFYSLPWGEEQLSSAIGLLILPLFSLAVFPINLIINSLFSEESRLAKQILIVSIAVFNFLNLVTLIKIIRLAI